MLDPKYLTPPSSSALKCSAMAPIVVNAKTPITMPRMVNVLRSLRRARFRKISMFDALRWLMADGSEPKIRCLAQRSHPDHDLRVRSVTTATMTVVIREASTDVVGERGRSARWDDDGHRAWEPHQAGGAGHLASAPGLVLPALLEPRR